MTKKQKIMAYKTKQWLDEQVKIIEMSKPAIIDEQLKLVNAGVHDYVQLYDCLYQIAELLELPIEREENTLKDGSILHTVYFIYKDVQFMQVI